MANIVAVSGKSSCKRLASYRKLIADVPQYWRNRSIPQTEHTLGAFIKRVPLHAFLWLASGAGLCQQRTMCRVLQLMNCGFCRLPTLAESVRSIFGSAQQSVRVANWRGCEDSEVSGIQMPVLPPTEALVWRACAETAVRNHPFSRQFGYKVKGPGEI